MPDNQIPDDRLPAKVPPQEPDDHRPQREGPPASSAATSDPRTPPTSPAHDTKPRRPMTLKEYKELQATGLLFCLRCGAAAGDGKRCRCGQ